MSDDEPFNLEDHLEQRICDLFGVTPEEMHACTDDYVVAKAQHEAEINQAKEWVMARLDAASQLFDEIWQSYKPTDGVEAEKQQVTDDLAQFVSGLRALYTSDAPADQWVISPRTYETIRFIGHFPMPTRKLRKCQLRRIAAHKRAWRKHRARTRMNRSNI